MIGERPAVLKFFQQIARYLLAAVFLLSAIAKLFSPAQFREFVSQLIALRSTTTLTVLYGLVGLEIGIALLLLFGAFYRTGAVVATGLLLAFTLVLMYSMQMGSPVNCGCFGEIAADSSIELSILRNICLLCLSSFILYLPSHAGEQQNGCTEK